jgi:TorA maturation chaperone TorD
MSNKSSICVGIALVVLAAIGPANSWAMSTKEADAIIRRAYNDYLGRDPDAAGLEHYRKLLVDEDWSEEHVRKDLRHSPEAKSANAVMIVKNAYRAVLGRDPDAEGLKMYSRNVEKDNWDQDDVEKSLKKSDEYKRSGVDIIIKRAYRDVLGRDPDKGGLENYRKAIIDDDWSENDLRDALKKSPEYRNRKK